MMSSFGYGMTQHDCYLNFRTDNGTNCKIHVKSGTFVSYKMSFYQTEIIIEGLDELGKCIVDCLPSDPEFPVEIK